MKIITSTAFEEKFKSYPDFVINQLTYLRALILETAKEIPDITMLEEALKWGEPGFISKHGSTLRIDWKKKHPNQYQMYFKCTSRLVRTFKIVFKDLFQYEDNRAIVFTLDQAIPREALKKCIKAALIYHQVKDDLTLGIAQDIRNPD